MSLPRSGIGPLSEHPVLSRGFMWIREVDADESPWPGSLVRYPDGEVRLHVLSDSTAQRNSSLDYGDWWSNPHSYCAETLYRNSGSIDLVFPKCEMSVRDLIARQSEMSLGEAQLSRLSEGQLVTIVLSILRTLDRWEGRQSEICGSWWLRHDGCPVFAFNRDDSTLLSESLSLIQATSRLGSHEWQQFVELVVSELRLARFDSSVLNSWEDYLFSKWGSVPILEDSKNKNQSGHTTAHLSLPATQTKDPQAPGLFLTDASLNDLISGVLSKFWPLRWHRRTSSQNKVLSKSDVSETKVSKPAKRSLRRKIALLLAMLATCTFVVAIAVVLSLEGEKTAGAATAHQNDHEIDMITESPLSTEFEQTLSDTANLPDEAKIWGAAVRAFSVCEADNSAEICRSFWSEAALVAIAELELSPENLDFLEEVDDFGGAKLVSVLDPKSKLSYLALLVSRNDSAHNDPGENETGWYVREVYATPERPAS